MPGRFTITLCYIAYFFVGNVLTVFGPLVPEITNQFAVSYTAVATAMMLNSVAYLPAVLGGGVLCGRYGARWVNSVGFAAMAAGYGLSWQADTWWQFAAGYCLGGGVGFGLVEAGLNALVMDLSAERKSAAMNLLHVFAAAGAVLGPFLARGVTAFTGNALLVYFVLMAVFCVHTIVFVFHRLPARTIHCAPAAAQWGAMMHSLRSPVTALLAAAMTFYVGAEIGLSNWMYSYVVTYIGGSIVLGACLSSLFWCGLGTGRMAAAHWSERLGYERSLFYGAILSSLALIPGLVARQPWVVVISFFLTGFLFAGSYPTIMAVGSQAYPGQGGRVAGLLSFFAGLGTMVFPPAMGRVADVFGIRCAMFLALFSNLALVLCTGILAWRGQKGRDRLRQTQQTIVS